MALTVIRTARPSPAWQESYVRVKKGQRLIIDGEGAWSPDLQNRTGWCGADGIPKTPSSNDYLLPGTNIGALIAKIGNVVFAVGLALRQSRTRRWCHLSRHERKSTQQ